jgi:cytochrome c oxidase cbb3-type subunit 1
MSAPTLSVAETMPSSGIAAEPRLSTAEIDRACRVPVLTLFSAAALWLALGAFFAVLSAIKAHAPGFLASPSWLTYGRVRPASQDALVYGFVLQAGLGVALWMFCRLGRNLLLGRQVITAATILWNIGLLAGFGSILAGASTGQEWLEMSGRVSPVLFCAYILIAVWGLITLHHRRQRDFYVSQWFLFAALFWFAWVYSTAQLLLIRFPVRGVLQLVVDRWYAYNLFELCLGSFGLAAIFYFLPKLLGRSLYNQNLALFGFWFLALFAGWGGLRDGYPVPNWLNGVSDVARVLVLVPVLAIAMSWYWTWARRPDAPASPLLRFFLVAAGSYLLAVVLDAVTAFSGINRYVLFTLYDPGVILLKIHGFLGLALTGAMYYIAPRLAGTDWPSPRWIQAHFYCAVAGILFTVLPSVAGGIIQGYEINQSPVPFPDIVRSLLPFLGTTTLGTVFLFVGYAIFLIHLERLLAVFCPCNALGAWFKASRTPRTSSGGATR